MDTESHSEEPEPETDIDLHAMTNQEIESEFFRDFVCEYVENIIKSVIESIVSLEGSKSKDRSSRQRSAGNKMSIICGNCGYPGHMYRRCKRPVTSFGVIALKTDEKQEKILMVQRKDTMAFVEILRGRFPQNETDSIGMNRYVIKLLHEMTGKELNLLDSKTFDELWEYLWVNKKSDCYKRDRNRCRQKYNTLNIKKMIRQIHSEYTDTEWGIPKGRLNITKYFKESKMECALREFCEETGYRQNEIKILPGYVICEEFTGTNKKKYKHIYYIGVMNSNIREPSEINKNNFSQYGEISDVKWFTRDQAIDAIRSYDIEKKRIINTLFTKIDLGLIQLKVSSN
jgi:8-oxo-dGTP pyrophosphatase MutT (NUDIX family)